MPNYKRTTPKPTSVGQGGVIRIYVNENGDIIAEYAGGSIEVIGTSCEIPAGDTLDGGDVAVPTEDVDGGSTSDIPTNNINGGGA